MDIPGLSYVFNAGFTLVVAAFLVPALLVSYPVVKWSRKCWIRLVESKYPNRTVVRENSIRTILDQGRNQAVYTLLLRGRSLGEGIRGHLLHLTSTKPFLRCALNTKWGLYTWESLEEFSVDNHLINSPCTYRGRPVTELNIQDLVSDITSKFLSPNHSPWQVHLITCLQNGVESQVCLVRAHHVLLRQEQLTLGDFLPLKSTSEPWACQASESPFCNLYSAPSALPHLHQKLTESFSNNWNEFLCNNDPTERPEILKKPIGLFQCLKIGTIVLLASLREITKTSGRVEGFWPVFWYSVVQREARRRNFDVEVILWAALRALNPLEVFHCALRWLWYLAVTLTLKTPILILREIKALGSAQKHHYPETLTSVLACYLPLIFQATMEVLSIVGIVVKAPAAILGELVFSHSRNSNLRTITPCGRKIVSWSEKVDVEVVRMISNVTAASEADVLLAAVVGSLKEYYRHRGLQPPQDILATAKFVSQRALYVKNHEARGLLCVALPTRTPLFDDDLIEILQVIQRNIQEARSKQSAIYAITASESSRRLLSSCLPSLLIKLVLNYLTSRYSLLLTHVDGDSPVEGVDDAIYWRPFQGNSSMSLTLHRHGKEIRLGIMVDVMLSHHAVITRMFPKVLQHMAQIVGVPRSLSRSPSPDETSPAISPGL
ncbi:uncharacterized protein LOC105701886 [Orussus abietinus]|uniref:uncharacterized protein LOC105701886 n=1 Tax=Orussus abietinus TaxID=222816 RepID=UPI000626B693|nr:uncharacterized protein LOC105701886 [Orussus abietinus]